LHPPCAVGSDCLVRSWRSFCGASEALWAQVPSASRYWPSTTHIQPCNLSVFPDARVAGWTRTHARALD
jgi:hypothetical protein